MNPAINSEPTEMSTFCSTDMASSEFIYRGSQEITVLFTSKEATNAAIMQAENWIKKSGASLRILVMQIVPFPESLDHPTRINPDIQAAEELAAASQFGKITVSVYLCRNLWEGLKCAIDRKTAVLVGARGRSWRLREWRLSRKLRNCGYQVYCVEARRNKARAVEQMADEPSTTAFRWRLRLPGAE
jgi:hypothetical protein